MPTADLAAARAALAGAPSMCSRAARAGRRRGLLVADMDSTIVTCETLDELAAFAGLGEQVAAITRASMNGEIDFREALRARVAMLRGLRRHGAGGHLGAHGADAGRADAGRHHARSSAPATALVSGGFTFFTQRVAALCGFAHHRANVLLDDGAALTGEVAEPILDRERNWPRCGSWQRRADCAGRDDGGGRRGERPGDAAGGGVGDGVPGQPVVSAAVANRVDFADLRALLFVQGYPVGVFREG